MDFKDRSATSKAILNFVYELPSDYDNFPEHVLRLLSKHFDQYMMTFIPLCQNYDNLRKLKSDYWISDYISLNIDPKITRAYNHNYYDKDSFRYTNLPEHLKNRPVLVLEDILGHDKYRDSSYIQFLQQHNVSHEALLNLRYKDVYLGAIGIFHTNEEGAFTPEQIAVLEEVSRFITQHYLIAMESTRRNFVMSMFKSEYRDLSLGVVMLNSRFEVIEANQTAQKYAKAIHKANNNQIYKSLFSEDAEGNKFPAVQQLINDMGHSMFYKNEPVMYSTGDCCYQFHTSTLASPSFNLSKVEMIYIVYIDIIEWESDHERPLPNSLTARETEIVSYISKGYTNIQISEMMHVSIHTVKTHVLNIYKKMEVNSRTALLYKLRNLHNRNT
jgi:DNA-binding CsgD family transcriptional regulator